MTYNTLKFNRLLKATVTFTADKEFPSVPDDAEGIRTC